MNVLSLVASGVSSLLGATSPNRPSSPLHNPSRADIVTVRLSLLHLLPIELVDQILHEAEYYTRYSRRLDEQLPRTVSASNLAHSRVLVRTPPIPRPESIVKVTIVTESHDQGWSSFPEDKGTHNNSWTWIDLRVCDREAADVPLDQVVLDRHCSGDPLRYYVNLHADKRWQRKEMTLERHHEFIKQLKSGDMLMLCAEARFPGWTNSVRAAQIEVQCFL